MARDAEGFDPSVPRPPKLQIAHLRAAIEHVEDRATEFIDVYLEQANVFSAVVGIMAVQALDSVSPYKKHKHPDVAQQRFPDLSLRGRLSPPPNEALESKASKRNWALQSHYDHPGWYVVWRYKIDLTRRMKKGKQVAIWRVDLPYLEKEDWKYEKSSAGESGGGRTHTFGVKKPSTRLKDSIIYQAPGIKWAAGSPSLVNGK